MTANKTMSVREMGKLLGLKKVESYWLVHKEYFETILVNGKMRVLTESFEDWYSRQAKYHKVTGEPPGEKLKEESYSPRDIAEMLGISESYVYEIMKAAGVEPVVVDSWQRFPRAEYEQWYRSQTRFRNAEDRQLDEAAENASMSMPEMARLLDVPRQTVYSIMSSAKGKKYLEVIRIADQKRITLDSFERWYRSQDKYLKPEDYPEGYVRKGPTYADSLTAKKAIEARKKKKKVSLNPEYLTIDQIMEMAEVTRNTVHRWIRSGELPAVELAPGFIRVSVKDFDDFHAEWLKKPRRRK